MKKNMNNHYYDRSFNRLELLKEVGFNFVSICDIGASSGIWSRECLKIFPDAQYFCVEPLDEHKEALKTLENKYAGVLYWQGCLGKKVSKGILNVDGHGSSILKGHWGNPYGIQEEVFIETLDSLVAKGICPIPDLIKLDVQGYELEVLFGTIETLKSTQAVIAEVSFFPFQEGMPVFHEVVGRLSDYGFIVSDILSLHPRPMDNMAGQADLLFIKQDHPLIANNQWDFDTVY